jgi:hypothetical protein
MRLCRRARFKWYYAKNSSKTFLYYCYFWKLVWVSLHNYSTAVLGWSVPTGEDLALVAWHHYCKGSPGRIIITMVIAIADWNGGPRWAQAKILWSRSWKKGTDNRREGFSQCKTERVAWQLNKRKSKREGSKSWSIYLLYSSFTS